jgi:hypothetical protein
MAEPVVYETQRWTDDQRLGFERLLKWSQISFEWLSDGSLGVDPADEDRVDALLDQFTSGDFSADALMDLDGSIDQDAEDEQDEAADDLDDQVVEEDLADQRISAATVDGDFDEGFAALVSLYEAAEAFSRNSIEDKVRGAFQRSAEAIDLAERPFGWEEDLWDYVCDRAALISTAIGDEVDHEVLSIDARGLREIIVRYL